MIFFSNTRDADEGVNTTEFRASGVVHGFDLDQDEETETPYSFNVTIRMHEKTHRYYVQGGPVERFTRFAATTTVIEAAGGFRGTQAVDFACKRIGERLNEHLGEAVTTTLIAHACKAPNDYRDKAADHGKKVHRYFEALTHADEIGDVLVPQEVHTACAHLRQFWRDWKVQPLLAEQVVCHIPYRYAGTLDLLAWVTDPNTGKVELAIIDLKTSKSVYQHAFIQLSAYVECLRWAGYPDLPTRRMIVHIPRGATRYVAAESPRTAGEDDDAFNAAAYLYAYSRKK